MLGRRKLNPPAGEASKVSPAAGVTRTSLLIALVLCLIAAACGGNDRPAPMLERSQVGTDTELVFWGWPGLGFDRLIQDWEDEHPGVTVTFVERDFSEHHELLDANLATGVVPDISPIEVEASSYFRSRPEDFLDLRTFGADEMADDYLDWRWAHGVGTDGSVIGLPTDVGGLAIAYRRDLFEAAGLPTDREDVAGLWATWNDFVEVGRTYRETSGRAFVDGPTTVFFGVFHQGTLGYVDADGAPIYRSNPLLREAWDVSVDMIQSDASAGLEAFSDEWSDALGSNDVAAILAPSWMTNYIATEASETEGLWDIAAVPGVAGNWGGSQLSIPARAEHPELAWDLIRFLTSSDGQLSTFRELGNFPSVRELYEHTSLRDHSKPFFNDAPVGRIYSASVTSLRPIAAGRLDRQMTQVVRQALLDVHTSDTGPEEIFEQLLDDLDEIQAGG